MQIWKKFVGSVGGFLKQGISPSALALAICVGVVLAVIPAFGLSTILCLAFIKIFRLNPAVVLSANQLAYPLQFVLFIPFLRLGTWLFNAGGTELTLSAILDLIEADMLNAISQLWQSTIYGLAAWLLVTIPLSYLLYFVLKKIFANFITTAKVVAPQTQE